MITIWKYKVEPDFINQVYMLPEGANILSFNVDPSGRLCFWAQVDTDAPLVERIISCVGTGWPLDTVFNKTRYGIFIGTVARDDYMWHLFDMGAAVASETFEVATESSIGEAPAHETNNN